MNNSPI